MKNISCIRYDYFQKPFKLVTELIGIFLLFGIITACTEPTSTEAPNKPTSSINANSSINTRANVLAANEPNGVITSPDENINIMVGDSVNFAATGTDPNGAVPLSYVWQFDGFTPNQMVQNPGLITIDQAGTYRVKLIVKNRSGLADSTPAERIITVNSNEVSSTAPIAVIDTPTSDMSILVGESIFFSGSGFSPINNGPLTFTWDFDGARPNSTEQTPGNVRFQRSGNFTISLSASDRSGLHNTNFASINVNVLSIGAENVSPSGLIVSPPGDISIRVGESVFFNGAAFDLDGNTPLSYFWNFSGAAPDSTQTTPGNVTFFAPGIYPVTMIVTDSLGMPDPNPPVRLITVAENNLNLDSPLETVIMSPPTDITVNLGESIEFLGEGATNGAIGPLRYLWDFDGFAPTSVEQNPGLIPATQPGRFKIRLTIADASGDIISKRVQRKIRVIDPNALIAIMLTPVSDQTVNLGDSLSFEAGAVDPLAGTAFEYHWRFDGAAADIVTTSPIIDNVVFQRAGKFTVSLNVMDLTTGRRSRSVKREISVMDPNALTGRIILPAATQNINPGETIALIAEVIDPQNSPNLQFSWTLDGIEFSTSLDPGPIGFNTPGRYEVSFTVMDLIDGRRSHGSSIRVKVMDPNALQVSIDSPTHDKLLLLGESINLTSSIIDPLASPTLQFHWEFDHSRTLPDLFDQNPGIVTFASPGKFEIELKVSDPGTGRRAESDEIKVLVSPQTLLPGASSPVPPPFPNPFPNPAPNPIPNPVPNPIPNPGPLSPLSGFITSPASDIVIPAGSTVNFTATAVSSAGNEPISYKWLFSGAAPNSTVQNPGNITFFNPGIYVVTLVVSDRTGVIDTSPPSVTIIVN